MFEALSLPFMQRALLAGLLIAFPAGFLGVFVVSRRLSFLGDGLAHAAFGGVALGFLLGGEPLLVALPFTLAAALGIGWVRNNTKLSGDTAIGIAFAVSMALGIVFLSLKTTYTGDAFAVLFGSILTVSDGDLWGAVALFLITLAALPLWSRLSYATFDAELAQADRLPVRRDDYLLLSLTALTVVASVKIVGAVLIAAYLVIPAATARLWAGSFFGMTVLSVVLALFGTVLGLAFSYALDLPSGATIVLTQAALFFVSLAARRA